MKIPLDHFEQFIDETILSRAANYFQKGKVDAFIEKSAQSCQVMVRGTSLYEVRLSFDKKDLVEANCTCPYDQGPICKHAVAVLFKLSFADDDLVIKKRNSRKKQKTPGTKVLFKEMFELLSTRDLQTFLEMEVVRNKEFRQQFFLHFSDRSEVQSIEWYTHILKSIIPPLKEGKKTYQLRKGREKEESMGQYAEQMERCLAQKQYSSAFYMAAALILHVSPYVVLSVSLNLHFGRFVRKAFGAIEAMVKPSINLKVALQEELLDFFLIANNQGWVENLDNQYFFLDCASRLALDDPKAQVIQLKVNEKKVDSITQRWTAEVITYRLMHYLETPESMETYALEKSDNHLLREELIHDSMHNGQWKDAENLAWDAVQQFPEFSMIWYTFLLELAEFEDQAEKKAKIAQAWILFKGQFDPELFEVFKSSVPLKQWGKHCSDFLNRIDQLETEESYKALLIADVLQFELKIKDLSAHLMQAMAEGILHVDEVKEYHDDIHLILGEKLLKVYFDHLNEMLQYRASYYNEEVIIYLHLIKTMLSKKEMDDLMTELLDKSNHMRSLMIKLRKFKREEL